MKSGHGPARRMAVAVLCTLTGLLGLAAPASAQHLMTEDLSGDLEPSDLVEELVGAGITYSNVTYQGAEVAAGTFSGGTGIIGFEDGIILSSGDIANVVGPNVEDGITAANGTPGDPDLDALSGQTTFDAAVLEFDFVPDQSQVSFRYVFASDEYNEYVNSQFNDVFAFFVNGENCAEVDGDPVSINTINNGPNNDGVGASNPHLYRNNDLDDGGGAINTEMDGLTVVLTCQAGVNAGEQNHMKLAIADASDEALDTNVFLQRGSLVSQPPSGDACPGYEDDPRNQVVGTPGNDVLIGTSGPDIICGLGGDDILRGRGGDDLLLGGSGADVLNGGAGDDTLKGGSGADMLRGRDGNDTLNGQGDRDELVGNLGDDTLRGGDGNDTLAGGAGNDLLLGHRGRDVLRGGRDDDILKGGPQDDVLNGGPDFDTCQGGPGDDSEFSCEA